QGAEKEDAARGHLPRDEAPRPLRKTLREEGPRKGGSRAPCSQACPQEAAARRVAADEAEADVRCWLRTRARRIGRPRCTGLSRDARSRVRLITVWTRGPHGPRCRFWRLLFAARRATNTSRARE